MSNREPHDCVGRELDRRCARCRELLRALRAVEQAYARLHGRAFLELVTDAVEPP